MQDLIDVYNEHSVKNYEKEKYYEGKIALRDVNLGIALPDTLSRLEIGCAWGAKCVDVLAARSMFDGFVTENGEPDADLDDIVESNHLIAPTLACKFLTTRPPGKSSKTLSSIMAAKNHLHSQ